MTKKIFRNLVIFRLVFALILLSTPISAHASVLSFVKDFFKGETIKNIENLNSQNMALLQATLNSDPNLAKGGGDITIIEDVALMPEIGPSGSMANIKDQTASDTISVYVVREGDSLSQIANMFNVSTNTIIWANDLHKSLIKEGQTLVILPVSGVKHSVVEGETLASITKKYKGDIDEIMSFNNLSENSKLAVGDIVIIPDGEIGSYSFGAKTTTKIASSNPYRGGSGPSYSDYYIIPVNGTRTQGLHGYNAIDIGAPIGTPIVASASGKVIISRGDGWNGGYGSYVVINHENGSQTLYAHMSEGIVYVGQHVVQGQVIGYVGSTGKSTGPHIHFEIRGAKNPF